MPNGVDKNLQRIRMACATYRDQHGVWPTEAWMEPFILHNLAEILDADDFVALATHLRLRTKDSGISVGGPAGALAYGDANFREPSETSLSLARTWLPMEPRRGLEH